MKDSNKNNKKKGIFFSIFIPMLIIVVFQLSMFLLVSLVSGEFTYVKDYSHSVLIEKTENRKNYIQNELQQKMSLVIETAEDVNSIVENILEEENATIDDISTNKELNKKILESSTENIISLLRRDMVNDVYIILDSGTLYYDDDNVVAKSGLFIRDLDPLNNSMSDNTDLLMEMGSSIVAQEFNITLDSEWSSKLKMEGTDDYSFYFKTIQTAKEDPTEELSNLGYWSAFSKISRSAKTSMKYTVPLIDSNGDVYGVLGIGIMEKMILKNLPSNDFSEENACYILGYDANQSGNYTSLLYSGSIYSRVITDDEKINYSNLDQTKKIFEMDADIKSIGNIQEIELYNSSSKYYNQKWALISVADENSVLKLYNTTLKTSFISALISLGLGIAMLAIISKRITSPIVHIIEKLHAKKDYYQIVKFESSNISEIDQLTDAITSLQINVKESASRVSKIISLTDVGMGVFTLNCRNNMVFISESLITLLKLKNVPQEDSFIAFTQFISYIENSFPDKDLVNAIESIRDNSQLHDSNLTDNITFTMGDHIEKKYLKLSVMKDNYNIIGVIQDVTNIVLEKQKIEYERDYDLTTGLLNRRAYYKTIEKLFAEPKKLKVSAFVMWDLDNLKYVNDTYGHDFGDDYIKTAANVFKQFKKYNGIVARMSGDEFNVFLSGYNSKEEILKIVNSVRSSLLNSYCLLSDGSHFKIRASGGISYYPYDSTSYDMLIKYADFAMYTIKHSTKGALAEFDMSIYNKDSILITGIEEMNRIIDEHSIKYAFQTIVSAKTGELYGYEALMRPQSTVFKSPLDLTRIAKACSKLYTIERLTWTKSMESFHQQLNDGKAPKNAKLFFNSISNCLINDDDIKEIETLHKDILPNLVMEILEGEQSNMDFMNVKINLLKKWKGQVALDDFGSGYNNEYALITFSPNIIKIDRAIISGCDNDISRQNIISNLVKISKVKNILVLAEGVETYDELKTVIEFGVDLIQGYYVSRPIFELQPVPENVRQEIKQLNVVKGVTTYSI